MIRARSVVGSSVLRCIDNCRRELFEGYLLGDELCGSRLDFLAPLEREFSDLFR